MKFKELHEARLSGGKFVGVITDDTTEGDVSWGSYGFNLTSGPIENQVARVGLEKIC